MGLKEEIAVIGRAAKAASRELVKLDSESKKSVILAIAEELQGNRHVIAKANALDLQAGKEAGLSAAMLDRLELNDKRMRSMIDALRQVANLSDPIGDVLKDWVTPAGLHLTKVRVPLGVIAIIYESRPNVTADAASLCLMASNAVILRGGKEALNSNRAIVEIMQRGGAKAGLPANSVQLVGTTDREAITHLVQLEESIDLVIPRGGEALIRAVMEFARVPVIKHYKGVCHLYVHPSASLAMAEKLIENSKCQRPGVCNALETLLIDEKIAEKFVPGLIKRLQNKGVQIRGDSRICALVPGTKEATEQDWYEEYLDLVLAVKVVNGIDAAIDHINCFGSHHSDSIVAADRVAQERFTSEVDSACVYVNTSTRFTDGERFGMGAEIGISTDKIHARGPMALEELTSYKYIGVSKGLTIE